MMTSWLVTGISSAVLCGLAIPFAQSDSRAAQERPTGRLTRVRPPASTQEKDRSAGFDADDWKKEITAGDLEEREAAFERLASLARRDPAAREALEAWSRDESDAGLAWTSRLILRESNRGHGNWMRGGTGQPRALHGQNFDFGGFAERFDDLDSMFGDLRTEWESLLHNLPNPSSGGTAGTNSSESMTLQSGPDGVTCKITTEVDGRQETREYSAESIEELLEANPELRGKVGGSGPMIWSFPNAGGRTRVMTPRSGGQGLQVIPRGSRGGRLQTDLFQVPEASGDAGEPRTDRLGIYCSPVEDGEGLHVESVQPGSIASVLGLRAGDVVVEINGTTIRSTEDVKQVLADRASDAEVRVVVTGPEGRRTLGWMPAAKKAKTSEKSKDL